ncbi:hypothetical protein DQ04_00971120 [Trypanosoma grayi]|uniref:hypothetical protein n=1 Tax=Trypanosoma grayi TaxID=71804 RepID=UPI0004F47856|nr:hypothetical protein DQ04_00971120 [Trypanosoma grayi]KEG13502.1 hypothetical protein DQ04_00971120 [Trypanosoma grayi]
MLRKSCPQLANGAAAIPAPNRGPCAVALASGAKRRTMCMCSRTAWEQRGPIRRHFCEFAVAKGFGVPGSNRSLIYRKLSFGQERHDSTHKNLAESVGGMANAGANDSCRPPEDHGQRFRPTSTPHVALGTRHGQRHVGA